jgi:hypothetical protein
MGCYRAVTQGGFRTSEPGKSLGDGQRTLSTHNGTGHDRLQNRTELPIHRGSRRVITQNNFYDSMAVLGATKPQQSRQNLTCPLARGGDNNVLR